MRELLTECGKLQVNLGHELFAHEIEIEKQILQPLNQVEIEANNISKTRRNLNKLILDMDSARTRFVSSAHLTIDFKSGYRLNCNLGIKQHKSKPAAVAALPKWTGSRKKWKKLS